MSVTIANSHIIGDFECDRDNGQIDIFTIRNVILSTVQSQVDISTFTQGRAYNVEISSIQVPEAVRAQFQYQIPILEEKLEGEEESEYWRKIKKIYTTEHADFLRRVLKDLRLAFQDPNETGFACYRAVEAIRKHFHHMNGIDHENTGKGWGTMHSEIGTSEEDIIRIQQEFANERRHGGKQYLSNEDREWVFEVTWKAVQSYIDYLDEKIDTNSDGD